MTGNWKIFPVWISVSASNSSSSVPNPPGKMMNATEYLMNIIFRTKKYRKLINVSTYGWAPCSNGSSMLHPTECPPPSRHPLLAASSTPGRAPVMIEKPASANSRAVSCAARYCGSSGPVLSEPKTETPSSTEASVSNPWINSLMILRTRQGSVRVKSIAGSPCSNNFSSSVIGGRSRIDSSITRTAPDRRLSRDGGVRPASRWPSSARSLAPSTAARSTVASASGSRCLPPTVRGARGARFFFLAIFLFAISNVTIASALPAQTLTGRVTDAGTGVGIVHAQVDIPQWALTSATDSAGRFTLSGVADGRWVIRARAPGYATSLATGGDIRVHPSPVVLACPKTTTVVTPRVVATPSAPGPGSLIELTVVADSATAVSATLFGQPISFTRDTATAHRFIGLAAVPLDSTHDGSVALTYVYPNGTAAHGTTVLPVTLPPVIASAAPPRREALHVASQFAARPSGEAARRVEAEGELAHTVGTASLGTRPLWHTPFEHPRPGRVTSPFGGGRMFNGQLQSRHAGTDFAGHIGDP